MNMMNNKKYEKPYELIYHEMKYIENQLDII